MRLQTYRVIQEGETFFPQRLRWWGGFRTLTRFHGGGGMEGVDVLLSAPTLEGAKSLCAADFNKRTKKLSVMRTEVWRADWLT